MEIYLQKLSPEDGKKYYDTIITLSGYPDAYAKPLPDTDMTFEEFQGFLEIREKMSQGLFKGRAPVTTYWVMDGDNPIGYATLKHVTEDKVGGNYGLCLLKEYQNKGIGTIVSDQLSEIAYNDLGLKEVIFTSKKENIQSQKSVAHMGMIPYAEHDGYIFYKLNLEEKFKGRER